MAAPMWESRVEDFVKGEEDSAVNEVARDLLEGQLKLLELVEALGPYLTSTEKHTRCRGTRLLADVLHRLPQNYLNTKEVEVIVVFFCDRLKDHHSVTPHVLHGMVALSQFSAMSNPSVVTMVREIFKGIHVQSLGQGHRRHVYHILATFLATRLEALKTMGGDFVYGYIQAMDGEKDPRNLMIAFDSVTVIVQHFPIGVFAEELFEVVGCYFPVDFTPPPNDPYRIKKEELVLALRQCLAASPKFAEYCLPMLLEKANAVTKSARLDAFQTLAASAETYGADSVKEYLGSFWSAIRREVLAGDEVLDEAALSAMTAITRTLSNQLNQKGETTLLNSFLHDVLSDCEKHLREPEMKLMYLTSKMLLAATAASDASCNNILTHVLPLLLEEFHKHVQGTARRNIVDILNTFIRAAGSAAHSNTARQPLEQHRESLGPLLQSLLTQSNSQLRVLGVQGISALQDLPGMADPEQREQVACHLYNLITQDKDTVVREESISALARMGSTYPEIVKQKVLCPLLHELAVEKMEVNGSGDDGSHAGHMTADYILHTGAALSSHLSLVQVTLPRYFQHIEHLDSRPFSEENLTECRMACQCVCNLVRSSCSAAEAVLFLRTCVTSRCFDLALTAATSEREQSALLDPGVVDLFATALRTVVQSSDESCLSDLVSPVVQAYLHGNTLPLASNNNSIKSFKPLEPTSPWQHSQVIPLMTAVLCSLPKQIEIPELANIMSGLRNVALQCSRQYCSHAAAKCYAALLNKQPMDTSLTSMVEDSQAQLEALIVNTAEAASVRTRALWLWICVTKALVLMGHPAQTHFVNKLLELLESPELADTAADGFRLVLCEFDDVMCAAMHANVRLMYRQRFFMQTHGQLVDGFNKTTEDKKQHYLTALSHHLKYVPKQVLMGEFPKFLPLLVRSLCYQNVALQLSSMTKLKDLMTQEPELLASHADDMLPHLLSLAQYKPSMKVRLAALQCLGELVNLPAHVVLPHRVKVIRALGVAVDDHKRLVRKEAAQARCEWFLLGTANK